MVVVHGCLQSAESMSLGTGFNLIAEKENLIVLYPQVTPQTHPLDCWSWYDPRNQRSDLGQLKQIMDEIRSVKSRYGIPNADVYAAGISSGGAMVAGLLACFPSEFKGAAVHSGPSYALAQDVKSAERVLKSGPPTGAGPCRPSDFMGKILVIQGEADSVVHPSHAERVIRDFAGPSGPGAVTIGRENGLLYTTTDYGHRGRVIRVKGLGHAWPGYAENLRHRKLTGPKGPIPTHIPFFTDQGPNATRLIWEFFR